jgi:DnaJ domain
LLELQYRSASECSEDAFLPHLALHPPSTSFWYHLRFNQDVRPMFSSSSNQPQRALARIVLADGKAVVAAVKLPMSGKLTDAFNGQEVFLDVILGDGTAQVINKSMIARAEAVDPPKAGLNQQRRSSDTAGFNAYAVLGLEKAATSEDIRAAYLGLVKLYHPDRFAGMDLPEEMKAYAAAMQARINMAYQQLGG